MACLNRIGTERSTLQQEEKFTITSQLKEKESELEKAQKELSKMNRRLFMDRMERKQSRSESIDFNLPTHAITFTKSHVIPNLGIEEIIEAPRSHIQEKFDSMVNAFPSQYIEDLEREGLFKEGLTIKGHHLLRELAERGSPRSPRRSD